MWDGEDDEPDFETDDDSEGYYDEEGNLVAENGELKGENGEDSGQQTLAQEKADKGQLKGENREGSGQQTLAQEKADIGQKANGSEGKVDEEEKYIRDNIKPEYIPGSVEFFEAVEAEAKQQVEKSTGEEFDEFNPQHIARFNYYSNKYAEAREAEMRNGLRQCRERDQQERSQQNFDSYLQKEITTLEMAKKFKDACDDLTVRQQREIDAQIAKGDYSSVQKIIDGIKGRPLLSPDGDTSPKGGSKGLGKTEGGMPRFASQHSRQPQRQRSDEGNGGLRPLSEIL